MFLSVKWSSWSPSREFSLSVTAFDRDGPKSSFSGVSGVFWRVVGSNKVLQEARGTPTSQVVVWVGISWPF